MSTAPDDLAPRRHKACYVGAPAIFQLELACQLLEDAFGRGMGGCYLVGSAIERPDWRDVDVRYILDDDAFRVLFPDAPLEWGGWEFDPRWLLLTTMVSTWLRKQTGLPVDFQFQPMTHANERHSKPRHALGMRLSPAR